ncbi:polyadenylate-binding protein-interacting protein 2 isoform 1-T1 [Podargus strigoides]
MESSLYSILQAAENPITRSAVSKRLAWGFLTVRAGRRIRDAAMKDPSRSSTSPSIISEDVIINGHSHEDDNPFAEYMWMENEEEFNRQIEEELWEEEFIERCFQEMLEEEEEHEWFIPARDLPQTMDQIQDQFNDLVISDSSSLEDLVVKSNLNPNAKEFVPGVKYLNI